MNSVLNMMQQIPTSRKLSTSTHHKCIPQLHPSCRPATSCDASKATSSSISVLRSCSSHTRKLRPCAAAQTRTDNLSILNGQKILRPYAASIDSGDDIESSTNVLVHYVARSLDLNRVKDLAGLLRGAVKRVNDSIHVALPKVGQLLAYGNTWVYI